MKHLFLLAYVEGSPFAGGDRTRVHSQQDLLPQFLLGNSHILAAEITTPPHFGEDLSLSLAEALGYAQAFQDGYMKENSVSLLQKLDDDFRYPQGLRPYRIVLPSVLNLYG